MPRPQSEATRIQMMPPSERRRYEASKEMKRKKAEQNQRFLCSIVLPAHVHDLIRQYALNENLPFYQAIEKSVSHCMRCFHEPDKEEEGE